MPGGWIDQLNTQQREAATHLGPPILVVAGAGTGKTLTIAARVAHLLQRGVAPQRILLLTFSRRAAREMLSRAGRLAGEGTAGRVWGGTFHATANRLLRTFGRSLGVPPDFTILDQADGADLLDLVRAELGLGQGQRRFPRKDTLASIYSRTVNAGTRLGVVLERQFPWCTDQVEGIRAIFEAYTRRKRGQNLLDYDDLLLFWEALAGIEGAGVPLPGLFDHILVDEYQDTNAIQARILRRMRPGSAEGLMAVGDDAQAIYSFRSATNRNILDFPRMFAGARVVRLEENYRSTAPILEVSNEVIALSPERHPKTLWTRRPGLGRPILMTCMDEADQSAAVCRFVLERREGGVPLRDQAVLFRAAHHSDHLEVELARRNIPFVKYGGLRFLEAAHVKDLLALLRILENPRDEVSWFRVLQLLDGVGPASSKELVGRLGVGPAASSSQEMPPAGAPARSVVYQSALRRLVDQRPVVPEAGRPGFDDLCRAFADCIGRGEDHPCLGVGTQIERLRRFLDPVVLARYSSPSSRLEDLGQLEAMAAGAPSRGRFLEDLTLDPPASTGDLAGPPLLDEDYLILSTIHSAKGCEWDVVHVIHAADGMLPSDLATGRPEEIEEERRLLYVALTRPRDALFVYFPLRYYRRPHGLDDAHGYSQPTRFLPAHVRKLFDERTTPGWDEASSGRLGGPDGAGRRAEARAIDRMLSALWE